MTTVIERQRGLRRERTQGSPRFRDGRFHNTHGVTPGLQGNSFKIMREFFFRRGRRTPSVALPLRDPRPVWARPAETGLRATWLGHSTLLLEIDGVRVLTDPVFGDRASPIGFAGPRRFHPVPVSLDQLPPLDLIVLSHDHFDHLCAGTMRTLATRDVPIVTSLGVGARLERLGWNPERITELDWWETHAALGGRLRVTATPAQHFSGRSLGDRNRTLWSSLVLEGSKHRVFFSGDTGLTDEFADIGRKLGPFDLVMLEIGAWHPAWGGIHLGPDNALLALELLGGGPLLPVHWGTFNLALHDWDEPAETLVRGAAQRGATLLLPRLGASLEPARPEAASAPWWRGLGDT